MTGGTYFSGGEGVGLAMRACGIVPQFGVEFDDAIAQVARDNGFDTITADVRAIDPAALPGVDWFHASPVCKNASNAKADGEESPEDIETAKAVERYIAHHHPRIFSLENVWGYREFKAFQDILQCLTDNGYQFEYWHLNAADYGVPQTRKRLILVARRDGVKPRKPVPTHFKNPSIMLGEKSWIGWYEAIEDLIPTLPESKFAQWQLDRLPKEITETFSIGADDGTTKHTRAKDEPANTVTLATGSKSRAYLVDSAMYKDYGLNTASQDQPAKSIVANYERRDLKAYITAGGDAWSPVLDDTEPLFTLSASKAEHATRAFIVGGNGNDHFQSVTIREDHEPVFSVVANTGTRQQNRAYLERGRVVKMTPRALARFQSFPDSYILPGKDALACKIIGNAVPPLLMQRVMEANR